MGGDKEKKGSRLRDYLGFLRRQRKDEEMVRYLKIGADNDGVECIYNYAVDMMARNEPEDGMKYLKKGVMKVDPSSMDLYAWLVKSSNPLEEYTLYKKAADKGCVAAMLNLSLANEKGEISPGKNGKEEAMKYMRMAKGANETCCDWLFFGKKTARKVKEADAHKSAAFLRIAFFDLIRRLLCEPRGGNRVLEEISSPGIQLGGVRIGNSRSGGHQSQKGRESGCFKLQKCNRFGKYSGNCFVRCMQNRGKRC